MPHKDPIARRAYENQYWATRPKQSKAKSARWRVKEDPAKLAARIQKHKLINPLSGYYAHVKHHYGLTKEEYDALYRQQYGKCYCCGQKKRLHVDHCHRTNKVRSLVCVYCNGGIARVEDPLHEVWIEYVRLHSEEY